jgi:hypothetical protein
MFVEILGGGGYTLWLSPYQFKKGVFGMIEPEMLYLDKDTMQKLVEIQIVDHQENWQKEGYEPVALETVIKRSVAEYYEKMREDIKNG